MGSRGPGEPTLGTELPAARSKRRLQLAGWVAASPPALTTSHSRAICRVRSQAGGGPPAPWGGAHAQTACAPSPWGHSLLKGLGGKGAPALAFQSRGQSAPAWTLGTFPCPLHPTGLTDTQACAPGFLGAGNTHAHTHAHPQPPCPGPAQPLAVGTLVILPDKEQPGFPGVDATATLGPGLLQHRGHCQARGAPLRAWPHPGGPASHSPDAEGKGEEGAQPHPLEGVWHPQAGTPPTTPSRHPARVSGLPRDTVQLAGDQVAPWRPRPGRCGLRARQQLRARGQGPR